MSSLTMTLHALQTANQGGTLRPDLALGYPASEASARRLIAEEGCRVRQPLAARLLARLREEA